MIQLFIPTNKGFKVVWPENIVRVEASSNYCKIFFDNDGPLTVAKVLKWFEEKLPVENFYRIHRGHLVNRKFIASVSCDRRLTLKTGEQLQVSKRKKSIVKRIAA
jgi:two-component system, LytTR family, response regulator